MLYIEKASGIYGIFRASGMPVFIGSSRDFYKTYSKTIEALKEGQYADKYIQQLYNSNDHDELQFIPLLPCDPDKLQPNLELFRKIIS